MLGNSPKLWNASRNSGLTIFFHSLYRGMKEDAHRWTSLGKKNLNFKLKESFK